ncbi:hypothetical protein HTZ84_10590 [Haloterrigena sp. SYSU A558-1]|uniref:Uncharacterized protein n=1 Tax=Haloterrigena gelatinilytica TaxID=2741724 RepID=A0A8J8KBN3_9EURY|nr:hypothetical protein [Haloterrigena gelatinilytica]NUB91510.1 hypothetical protein [Haloterrigena gelatinilytica]NUC72751.1 hypothetical protein [Haloterrigena gelatinilytica]
MLDEGSVPSPRSRRQAPVEPGPRWAKCATCNGTLRRGAISCPHCGARTRHWWLTGPGAWLIATGALVGGLLIAVGWRRVTQRLRARGA